MPVPFSRTTLALAVALAAGGCGKGNDGTLEVSVIGAASAVTENGPRLSMAAQVLRAATTEGLVGFDAQGRVVPALADRWIVTDDGRSYIFRLRDGKWPDGSAITGETAASALRKAIAALKGTPLALDLGGVSEIRAMAGRVIEVRLANPNPDFLTLLAQPELGLPAKRGGAGPMILRRDAAVLEYALMSPEQRGEPAVANFAERSRLLRVRVENAQAAVDRFNEGDIDVVLGGQVDTLPLAGAGGLLRGNVQLDPVIGLFGLMVEHADGFLSAPANREALAMAIDRDGLLAMFNVRGWQPSTRVVSPDVTDDLGTVGERWTGMTIEQRRATAAARVEAWKAQGTPVAPLRIAMPDGPGSRMIFGRLKADFAGIGLVAEKVGETAPADLRLVDLTARYGRATWFLDQLACAAGRPVCSEAGDARVAEARAATDPQQRAALLAEAEAEVTAAGGFIPFARPMRWSLVRSSVVGFAPSPWGWHPLPPFALLPK